MKCPKKPSMQLTRERGGRVFPLRIPFSRYLTVEDGEEEFDMADLPQEFMEPSDLDSPQ